MNTAKEIADNVQRAKTVGRHFLTEDDRADADSCQWCAELAERELGPCPNHDEGEER